MGDKAARFDTTCEATERDGLGLRAVMCWKRRGCCRAGHVCPMRIGQDVIACVKRQSWLGKRM